MHIDNEGHNNNCTDYIFNDNFPFFKSIMTNHKVSPRLNESFNRPSLFQEFQNKKYFEQLVKCHLFDAFHIIGNYF